MKIREIIFTIVLSALVCFGLCQQVQSATDTPDPGPLPVSNTADGQLALAGVTGIYNSGFGIYAGLSNGAANFNTAIGGATLLSSTSNEQTAVGAAVLFSNTTGGANTGVGAFALFSNVDGSDNNAVGDRALQSNVSGFFNNAHGRSALFNNTNSENNAFGDLALENVTTGASNTAIGDDAGRFLVDGSANVCVGDEAGTGLGGSVNNCIAIGAPGAGPFATFDNTCFIGSIFGEPVSDPGTQTAVFVDQFNVVGIFNSSRQYKHDIQPMDKASETLYQLKPVTFKFNSDWKGTTQYGLIAEEVAEVDPQLVVRRDGETITVRYEQVNAMLLNEFLKEHNKVQALETTIAQQQKGMEVLTAQLKEQAAQIQKVSAQLEVNKPAPQVVANKR